MSCRDEICGILDNKWLWVIVLLVVLYQSNILNPWGASGCGCGCCGCSNS